MYICPFCKKLFNVVKGEYKNINGTVLYHIIRMCHDCGIGDPLYPEFQTQEVMEAVQREFKMMQALDNKNKPALSAPGQRSQAPQYMDFNRTDHHSASEVFQQIALQNTLQQAEPTTLYGNILPPNLPPLSAKLT